LSQHRWQTTSIDSGEYVVLGGNQRSPSLSHLCRVDLNYLVSVEEAMNRLQLHLVSAFLLFMVLPIELVAQGGSAPVIVSATVQYEPDIPWQLTISGRNFKPSGTNPTIYFGSVQLISPAASDILIEAAVPPTAPGTYLLSVTNSKKVTGTAYVTIGAVGPTGGRDQPFGINVNCDGEGSVIAALNQAGTRVATTTININGFCNEEVFLWQSNVTFHANSSGAGFGYLHLYGAHGVRLENLRLARGLEATGGATFVAENLQVDQPDRTNVSLQDGASGSLINPTLTNCYGAPCAEAQAGAHLSVSGGKVDTILVTDGGMVNITETLIQGGLGVDSGGSAYVDRATIEMASGPGVYARGAITLNRTLIRNNALGIAIDVGGSVDIRDESKILGNAGVGIEIYPGGLALIDACEISDNGRGVRATSGAFIARVSKISSNKGRGIEARGTSTIKLTDSTVESNQGDGIWLEDLSFLDVSEGMTYSAKVRSNTGWGLHCSTRTYRGALQG
jgi:hypothetical protein